MKLFVFFILLGFAAARKNVCPTWLDYWGLLINPRCWEDPDQQATIYELGVNHNHPMTMFEVTTDDGYQLQLFRLAGSGKRNVSVVLAHGIYMGAIGWTTVGNDSLAFVLAREGYDVWLVSLRGTQFGNKHINYTTSDAKYWDFSVHEMGTQDLPAIFKLVYSMNNRQRMKFIGYSLSATAYLIFTQADPRLAERYLERGVLLAPVAYLEKIPSALGKLQRAWPMVYRLSNLIGVHSVFAKTPTQRRLAKFLFLMDPLHMEMYMWLMGAIFGRDRAQFNPKTLPITVVQGGDAIAMNVVEHYHQIMQKNVFQAMYYRKEEDNIRHYNSTIPPVYNLSECRVPTVLLYAQNDAIATPANVQRLYNELPKGTKCIYKIGNDKHNHQDFVIAKSEIQVYESIANNYLLNFC